MAVTGDAMTGQPTALPTRKVAGGGIAGTVGTLLIWLYDICGLPGTPIPPEVAAALATVAGFAVSYATVAGFAVSYATAPAPIETVLSGEDEFPVRQPG